jgi:hypothetical protein
VFHQCCARIEESIGLSLVQRLCSRHGDGCAHDFLSAFEPSASHNCLIRVENDKKSGEEPLEERRLHPEKEPDELHFVRVQEEPAELCSGKEAVETDEKKEAVETDRCWCEEAIKICVPLHAPNESVEKGGVQDLACRLFG